MTLQDFAMCPFPLFSQKNLSVAHSDQSVHCLVVLLHDRPLGRCARQDCALPGRVVCGPESSQKLYHSINGPKGSDQTLQAPCGGVEIRTGTIQQH